MHNKKKQEQINIDKKTQKRDRSGDPTSFNIVHEFIEWISGRCGWTVTLMISIISTVIAQV